MKWDPEGTRQITNSTDTSLGENKKSKRNDEEDKDLK